MKENKPLDQYFTDPYLVSWIVRLADPFPGMRVLEPSAGDGVFVAELKRYGCHVTAIEIDPALREPLLRAGADVVLTQDVMAPLPYGAGSFDLVIGNPPFSEGADGKHVQRVMAFGNRGVFLVRANFMLGKRRFARVFKTCQVTRDVVLVHRPPFHGPDHAGFNSSSDHMVIELKRRGANDEDSVKRQYWLTHWTNEARRRAEKQQQEGAREECLVLKNPSSIRRSKSSPKKLSRASSTT